MMFKQATLAQMSAFPNSEKYRKYLIELSIEDSIYYTVSGMDIQDEEKDKLLVNRDNKIAAFTSIDTLLHFINGENSLFDLNNLRAWANSSGTREGIYSSIEFRTLNRINEILTSTDVYAEMTTLVYMFKDYAIQTNNAELLVVANSDKLVDFTNFYVENYVLEGTGDRITHAIKVRDDIELIELLKKVKDHLSKSIAIY